MATGDMREPAERERERAEHAAYWLAAIVESSQDAIISKDLNGVIETWNAGAEQLFGYSAEEAIGQPITFLMPEDRVGDEPIILGRIRRGERIEHYETVRRRKDGSLIDISLTVSPIRNAAGQIVGASKIARDITERKRAQQQQQLLLREMDHRIKNLFALSASVVTLSAQTARAPAELAETVGERLNALARAHALTLPNRLIQEGERTGWAELHTLIRTIVEPYEDPEGRGVRRVAVRGDDLTIDGDTVTSFALLLHEFTTNAVKYGALSVPAGHITIDCEMGETTFVLTWTERGGPPARQPADAGGFGTRLAEATVHGQFGGAIERDWRPEGIVIRITMPRR